MANLNTKQIVTRFAPSPTGYMHIGNLRTALYAWLFAKSSGGKFILRIEDTDLARYVDGAVDVIYNTLGDIGMDYDEVYVQSDRLDIYKEYAQRLIESGAAYYCFCGAERLKEMREGGATKYDKHCLHLSGAEAARKIAAGEPYCIRQNIPEEGSSTYTDVVFGDITVDNKELEDNVLVKSDGRPTYNFAHVVDDYLMGVTHVIRGSEYLSSTPKYNYLYRALGWELPVYIHLQPIMKDAQHKLSKRHGDASYEDFKAAGFLPQAIVNYIALLGWNPKSEQEKFTMQELVTAFSPSGLSKSPSIFDEVKMRWLNSLYIKELPAQEFGRLAQPWFAAAESALGMSFDRAVLTRLLQGRIEILSEIPQKLAFLGSFEGFDLTLFEHKKNKTDIQAARELLPHIVRAAEAAEADEWRSDALFARFSALSETLSVKPAALLWIMRIAISGTAVTPGGATELAELLGRDMTLSRLGSTLSRLLQ